MTVTHTRRVGLAIVAIAVAALLAPATAAQQRAQTLFERARMIEETSSRNLAEAIGLYEQVATRRTENPQLAAQAQLRIGLLYERLGRAADAQRAFEAVVTQHAGQTAVVAEARAHLKTTGDRGVQPGGNEAVGPRMVRRLGPEATDVSLSPDGRTLAMHGLSLLDIATGKTTRLKPNPDPTPVDLTHEEWADWPVLTRDSRQVAYHWWVSDGTPEWSSQLRVMSTEPGAKPRTLVDNPAFDYIEPVGWSNDAKSLLAVIKDRKGYTGAFAWVSAADGKVTMVESLGWRLYGRASLSPDGRYIAYSALTAHLEKPIPPAAAKLLERHIYVLASDGSSRAELSLTAGVADQRPVWSADGKAVVFSSNRSGTWGLWSIPVSDGKAAGDASLVRGNTGEVEPIGVTPTGTLYYSDYSQTRNVSIMSTPAKTGASTRVETVPGTAASWSPDGKTVAIMRPNGEGGSPARLVLYSIETGQERLFARDGLLQTAPRWFSDGRRLLVAVAEKPEELGGNFLDGAGAWYSLDRQSGAWTRILPGERRGPVYVGPDAIYYIAPSGGEKPDVVMKVDPATGARTQAFDFAILPKGNHNVGNLSPDGRTWAIRSTIGADTTYVFAVAMDGSGYRELYHAPKGPLASGLQWSGDSRTIYWAEKAAAKDGPPRRFRVMRIAASGGPVQSTGIEFDLDGDGNGWPEMAPDVSHVAVMRSSVQRELWAIDIPNSLKAVR